MFIDDIQQPKSGQPLARLLRVLPKAKVRGSVHRLVKDITFDSRTARQDSMFVCLPGLHQDGHSFAQDAVRRGARVVVASRELETYGEDGEPATLVLVDDTRRALALIAAEFYGQPSRSLNLIGVTGTNGKTTVTHLIGAAMAQTGERVAVIGTLGAKLFLERVEGAPAGIATEEISLENTTPQAPQLQRLLFHFKSAKVRTVVMEVSSHALAQDRTLGCLFDAAVFTNLSRDHLDFHGDIESYFQAKALLFTRYAEESSAFKKFVAVLNGDTPYGARLRQLCHAPTLSFGFSSACDVQVSSAEFSPSGSRFTAKVAGKEHEFTMRLVGQFNVYNAAAALATVISQGVSIQDFQEALKAFVPLPGRLEVVDEGQPFTVTVDYAHTPDGLQKVLETVRQLTSARVICVFGCGGDRDTTKRPEMGRIATTLADYTLITSDNPRSEDPLKIIEEILSGVVAGTRYFVEPDRRRAIYRAIAQAQPGDFVVIAGKGHETYQILGDRNIPFDDREVAREALRQLALGH